MSPHNHIRKISDLMDRAASLESSLRYYDHAEGARIAARANTLRDKAQKLIDQLPAEDRARWTRSNNRG